jgi:hypothetical protein
LADDEMLIPVAHFYKDVFSSFGIPFFIKVKHVSFLTVNVQYNLLIAVYLAD